MADTRITDEAVRDYLLFLEDPDQLVDHDLVKTLETRVQQASDPLDRLVAIAEYERARHPVEESYRQAFIEHAKEWAAEHNVPASAFERLGVPSDVLRTAGISTRKAQPRPARGAKTVTSVDELKAVIRTLNGAFTANDLTTAAGGGSPMTVRKALKEAVDEGSIRNLGPVPDWNARGRVPFRYERTT